MTHHSAIEPATHAANPAQQAISETLFILNQTADDLATTASLITRLDLSHAGLAVGAMAHLCDGAAELVADICECSGRLASFIPAERIPRTPTVRNFEAVANTATDISHSLMVIIKIAMDATRSGDTGHMIDGFPAWFAENLHRQIDDLKTATSRLDGGQGQ